MSTQPHNATTENFSPLPTESPIAQSQRQTLRQRLLVALLPTILIPLFVTGFLGYNAGRNRGRDAELDRVKKDASLTSRNINTEFGDTLHIAQLIGLTPSMRTAFQRAQNQVKEEGLEPKSIAELEKQFASTHQLPGNVEMNQYLRELLTSHKLAEAFITDRNGLTIAAGGPTSDFVQRDESWWQIAAGTGQSIDTFKFDESTQQNVISLSQKITDPGSGNFLGIIKISIDAENFTQELVQYLQRDLKRSERVQLIDNVVGKVVTTVAPSEVSVPPEESQQLLGGNLVAKLAGSLSARNKAGIESAAEIDQFKQQLQGYGDFKLVSLDVNQGEGGQQFVSGALIQSDKRYYSLTPIPHTELVAISSTSIDDAEATGRELLAVSAGTSWLLGAIVTGLVLLLARQLSQPLLDLTRTATAVAAGDLSVRAKLQGTAETETLGQGLNNLLNQIQNLLKRQEEVTAGQRQQREDLENDVVQLMEDVGNAAVGDLTVRAQLSAGDVGIVADLFNSIIENLRDTAMQVKLSSGQVSTSLDVNAEAIRSLATQAISEAESLRSTMGAVEEMSDSIQMVASNAEQASQLTDQTYITVQDSSQYMDQAVDSILNLRSTVGETAKKIKRLGESAQKISQTVSLIDEIALKTNLLAVNASVEAARAGELGQGFTAVAEQVGSLAEQSASATKEIALIVAAIQAETQEVVAAIETGTAQVVDSTKLVEATKQRLTQVLEKSEQINQLMRSISASTTAQTETSALVTNLVKTATQSSEQRSQSSEQMARAIQDTAEIARSLQESVAQFKVTDSPTPADLTTPESLEPLAIASLTVDAIPADAAPIPVLQASGES
jgi:methyl-accepting chemotaxis protein PixJ